jgi:acyl-CoA thioesterase-1
MQNPMIQNLIQFTHLEKTYGYLPGISEATQAALFGLEEATYREIKDRFGENAREAAQELLENRSFAERVDRLPFRSGDTVVAVGDSFTDDLQSWLEIMHHLLGARRPHDEIRLVNAGVSAQTTAMALRRFVPLISQEPDWIVCFLGGNDTTRIGPEPNKPQVSFEETAKNLQSMRRMASVLTDARWVWITPPTFDEERAAAYHPSRWASRTGATRTYSPSHASSANRKSPSWICRRPSGSRRTRRSRDRTGYIRPWPARKL